MRNVLFVELSKKIILLTDQVEQLINDKNEENCSVLLLQRHELLLELHENIEQVVSNKNGEKNDFIDEYHHFLKDIQQRDSDILIHLDSAQKEVAKALSRQVAGTKAVSAYKNVIID